MGPEYGLKKKSKPGLDAYFWDSGHYHPKPSCHQAIAPSNDLQIWLDVFRNKCRAEMYMKPHILIAIHSKHQFTSIQLLRHVGLFATPWTTASQASLSITISQSLHKLMSIESVMPSNHLILCCPLLLLPSIFPRNRVFSSESVPCIRWQNIAVSASTSVPPMNTQD